MKLEFDLNNNVEKPELILGKRNYDKLGSIVNFDNLSYDYNLMSADSISFTVYKELNCRKERLWDEIKERRLIWLKEFNEWFQIDVVTNDENGVTKEIIGTSLCEAELGQILIKSTEINTENDIARPEYINPTVFYKPSNHEESLLHRLLKEAPNYYIKYVDDSLWNIQRTFSIDGTSIYDELSGEIAEEIGCLFLFNSADRSISVYDLKTNCNHCGYRGDYTDICPECGSSNLNYGYGYDTTIFVDSETLAENISLSGKQDEVKNYIKVSGGDDIIDAAISACNPTGTQYIYAFSERDREDMSNALVTKLDDYVNTYDSLTPTYQAIMKDVYDAIDEQLYLESTMMPDIETAQTSAGKELAKLTSANLSPVAVQDLSIVSIYTVNSAVLGMAKCIVNSTVYKIEIIDSSFASETWKGKFRVTNYSDEEDTAENTGYITIVINDDYAYFVEQKIKKAIDRNDVYLVDMFDVETDFDTFKEELKKYCLNRLNSFESAYQTIIDVLIESNCSNNSTYGDIYNDLYVPYYNKLIAIQEEIGIRSSEIEAVDTRLTGLEKSRSEITTQLNLQNYLGDELWKELCSFRREDSYENSNYISDGLDNAEIIAKAQELFNKAKIEAVTASTLQMSLSAKMFNLLAIPEFKKLTGMFEGGNWIRIKSDDKIYRLRLIHFKIDFTEIQNIEVEFSDVTQTANGLNDTKSLMDKVSTMATNFSYVAHQAEQGSKSFTELDAIKNDGLNAALYNVSNSVNQEFLIDEHGITGRQWDDILNDYSSEQIKINNNIITYTDDYWQTAKCALGKIQYYNPILKTNVSQYGLIADAVISGILMGNDIIGGAIYSMNFSDDAGTYIDLVNGDFSFAGRKLQYVSETNSLNLTGKIIFEDIDYSDGNAKSLVKNSLGITATENSIATIENDISNSNSTIEKLKKCLGFTTEISSDYVISPYIGGGYLQIENTSYGMVIIDPSNIKKTGYIFGIYNSSKSLVAGVDTNGNGILKGSIITDSGLIGGFTIGNSAIYNGTNSLTSTSSGIYLGIDGIRQYASSSAYVNISNGILTAKGANISGTITTSNITATGGKIGGFNIGSSAIYNGTNSMSSTTSGVYLGTSGIRVYSSSSAYVNISGGVLTSVGANISGAITTSNITATGGTIGGISIGNGLYYSGTSSTDGFGFWKNGQHPSNGSCVIMHAGANNTNIGGAPFRVYQNGDLYCNNANISNANITGGTFSIGSSFNVSSSGILTAKGANIGGTITTDNINATGGKIGDWTIDPTSGCLYGSGGANAIRLFPKGVNLSGYTYYLVIYDSGGSVPIGGLTPEGWRTVS